MSSAIKILALDPGISMGWAKHIPPGEVEAGRIEWKIKKGIQPGVKLADFRYWLVDKLMHTSEPHGWEEPRIDLLIVEAPLIGGRQSSMAANRSAYGWNSIAEEVAATYGISYVEVYAVTVKKFATGSGRASKELVLSQAINKWPHLFPDEVRGLRMTEVRTERNRKGKMVQVETWDPVPDPKLFEISDALWLMQYAREEVKLTP